MRTTDKRQSDLLLLDAVDVFNAKGVSYAVVGGFAAAVHGVDRGTKHLDVLLQVDLPELRHLVSRLQEAGFETELQIGGFDACSRTSGVEPNARQPGRAFSQIYQGQVVPNRRAAPGLDLRRH